MPHLQLTVDQIELLLVLLQVNRDSLEMMHAPDITAMAELKLTKATIHLLEEAR